MGVRVGGVVVVGGSAVQSALTDVLYITCHFIPLEYWGVAKLKPARYSNPSPAPLQQRWWWWWWWSSGWGSGWVRWGSAQNFISKVGADTLGTQCHS